MDILNELLNLPVYADEKRDDGGGPEPGDWMSVKTYNSAEEAAEAVQFFLNNNRFQLMLPIGARIEFHNKVGVGSDIIYFYSVSENQWQKHLYCYSD
ncbi:MAG TPA: hypothetical protein PLZ15_06015 [Melioribacteraceae bacterium]|nr:hypothetical protein [Melioribacteraceae bacterium]